ncbi:RNA polymerase sigma-70 factor, ECF subfamily [Lentzea waywayandensis]|uniref:RNA polymerase sigma factor n=1 Tax=Lentzea waywayandensis TaxID=84724 RepID=A0A1I6D3U6_9PSEU|nr:sigma-70 family RNA polymerase sigma factor [Lentzea waywayandensis]SFR00061.1 RNA polymerase sigma-70 factor, ECF subfamily [Lentzea waywayandensis]
MTTETLETTLDDGALADLYNRHGRAVHMYVRTLTIGDALLAEDILQETFLRAWRTPRLAVRPEAARAWLVTVARNLFIDRVRLRNRRPQEAGDTALPNIPAQRCEISRVVDSVMLADALAKLRLGQRDVVVQTYLYGRTADEVSTELGIPVGTVKSRLHSALRLLRSDLESADLCLAA